MKLERVITINTSGDDVKWMQERLLELGYYKGKCNGQFGQNTLIAITRFQRSMNLKPNGVVSLQTWSRLKPVKIKSSYDKTIHRLSYINEHGLKLYTSNLNDDFYYKEKTDKSIIWLKNTQTSHDPKIDNWDKAFDRDKKGNLKYGEDGKIIKLKSSTTFTIGGYSNETSKYDGKIFNNFEDEFWSYHSPFLSSDKRINPKSISIEICNYGPLFKNDDGLFYTKNGVNVQEQEVCEIDFRGYKYWHKYTDKQVEALRKLLVFLLDKWDISIDADVYNLDWFDYNKKYVGAIRTDSQISFEKLGITPQPEIIQMLNSL